MTRRFRIVVALDDSEYAEIVLEHAFDQAMRHGAVELHFIAVVGREQDMPEAEQYLATQVREGVERCGPAGGDRMVRLHVRAGHPVEEIVRLANEIDADLILVGRFGAHQRRSSTATSIVEQAPCPVLVVGLTEHAIDTTPQCPKCMAIRRATDAESWFCSEHTGDPRLHSSSLLPWSSTLSHGRLW